MRPKTRKCAECKKKHTCSFDGHKIIWPSARVVDEIVLCNNSECQTSYITKKMAKAKEAARKKANKEYKEKTKEIKERSYSAQVKAITDDIKCNIFNPYIKLRDFVDPCISCGDHKEVYEAGHFLSVGARKDIRFNEDNCHKQCLSCNRGCEWSKAKEMVVSQKYRINLIDKIGLERVEALERVKTHKYTLDELKNIKDIFRRKLKKLKKLKGENNDER